MRSIALRSITFGVLCGLIASSVGCEAEPSSSSEAAAPTNSDAEFQGGFPGSGQDDDDDDDNGDDNDDDNGGFGQGNRPEPDPIALPPAENPEPPVTTTCGERSCRDVLVGDLVVEPCCPEGSETGCGLDLSAVSDFIPVAAQCAALAQPGNSDGTCPSVFFADPAAPQELPGCCMPSGQCGVAADLSTLLADFGCVDARTFLAQSSLSAGAGRADGGVASDATEPVRCTPELPPPSGADGGTRPPSDAGTVQPADAATAAPAPPDGSAATVDATDSDAGSAEEDASSPTARDASLAPAPDASPAETDASP